MRGWKSYLLWEGLPFLVPLFFFGLISAINWDYERKMIVPDPSAGDWHGVHLGQIMLGCAFASALVPSIFLFVVRQIDAARPRGGGWYASVPIILIAVLFTLPGIFIVVMGPAAITMMEQMRTVPRQSSTP